jgi:hypothetical protein
MLVMGKGECDLSGQICTDTPGRSTRTLLRVPESHPIQPFGLLQVQH